MMLNDSEAVVKPTALWYRRVARQLNKIVPDNFVAAACLALPELRDF